MQEIYYIIQNADCKYFHEGSFVNNLRDASKFPDLDAARKMAFILWKDPVANKVAILEIVVETRCTRSCTMDRRSPGDRRKS